MGAIAPTGLPESLVPLLDVRRVHGVINIIWARAARKVDEMVRDHLVDLQSAASEIVRVASESNGTEEWARPLNYRITASTPPEDGLRESNFSSISCWIVRSHCSARAARSRQCSTSLAICCIRSSEALSSMESLCARTHGPIAVFFCQVSRRSNLRDDSLSCVVQLSNFFRRLLFGRDLSTARCVVLRRIHELSPSHFLRDRDSYWHTSHMYLIALWQRSRKAMFHLGWNTVEQIILQGQQPVVT